MLRRTQRSRRQAAAGTGVALALVLSGCSGSEASSEKGESSSPVRGGELTFRLGSDEGCADPQQHQLRSTFAMSRQIVDSLTFQNSDGDIVGWLASEWQVNADATEYTFTLRDGVTFSDGTEFTSASVKANFDGILAMGALAAVAGPYLSGYQATQTPDPQTAIVTFSEPNAQFLQATSTASLGMLSDATVGADLGERCSGDLIGTGPFTLADYTSNESYVLERRDDYDWGADGLENTGAAYLDSIVYKIVPTGSVATGMLTSGQLDVMGEIPATDVDVIESSGNTLLDRQNPGFPFGFFENVAQGPLADQAVRQAISKGIDRQEIVDTTLSSAFHVAKNTLAATTPGFTDASDRLAYDPDGAAKLLEDAGWTMGSGGVREKDGTELEITANYQTPGMDSYVPGIELAQQQLAEIGIKLTLEPLAAAAEQAARRAGDFELRFSGMSRADPDVLRSMLTGMDPEVDTLLAAQAGEGDQDTRMAIVEQLTDLVLEKALFIPFYDFTSPLAYTPQVHGYVVDATNTPSLSQVWKS